MAKLENFTLLRPTTKQAQKMVGAYKRSDIVSIYEAYGRPSGRKVSAMEDCRELCKSLGGRGLVITGAGSSFFSVGFVFEKDGQDYLAYITPSYQYAIPVEKGSL